MLPFDEFDLGPTEEELRRMRESMASNTAPTVGGFLGDIGRTIAAPSGIMSPRAAIGSLIGGASNVAPSVNLDDMGDAINAAMPSVSPRIPTPGSGWRLSGGGAFVHDGFDGAGNLLGAIKAPSVGAGYGRNAAPGDMDWGNRINMEAYTNPLVQDQIRQHSFRTELQDRLLGAEMAKAKMHADTELEKARIFAGAREGNSAVRSAHEAASILANPNVSAGAKHSAIDSLTALDEGTRANMKLDALTSIVGPDGKSMVPIGVVEKDKQGKATGVDYSELLSRIPEDTPQADIWRFLGTRGIQRDDVRNRWTDIVNSGSSATKNEAATKASEAFVFDPNTFDKSKLTPKMRREYDLIMSRLGRR